MSRLALAFCVHHKPWLMMSTLITALAQDLRDADLFFLYNVGDGRPAVHGNAQLSPFDERVREVCRVSGRRVTTIEYQNDDALDSGAWYKFLRDRHWEPYDYMLFAGEGTLLARRNLLSSMLSLAQREGAHVIASGHEERRLPKDLVLHYSSRSGAANAAPHDAAIAEAFAIFSRDPDFRRLFEAWGNDFAPETHHHVPAAGPPSAALRQVRDRWARLVGRPEQGGWWRELPFRIEASLARRAVNGAAAAPEPVGFFREPGPEWFGCATNHFMSRTLIERFVERLDAHRMWDVLDLPFAGTPLEVIWGFVPAWLGFDKWFTDGFHRPRKDFVTYRREDYPPQMATYINRYYAGDLVVGWHDDFLRIDRVSERLSSLRDELPPAYFQL